MNVTAKMVAEKLAAYLRHEITLAALVDWAERAIADGEFEPAHFEAVRGVLARVGLGDVRAFGLRWEDCESMLKELGYSARVDVVAS